MRGEILSGQSHAKSRNSVPSRQGGAKWTAVGICYRQEVTERGVRKTYGKKIRGCYKLATRIFGHFFAFLNTFFISGFLTI